MDRKNLVVVIPGIGGSILRRKRDQKILWTLGYRALFSLLTKPERLDLTAEEIEPAGLLPDLQLLPGWTAIEGYSSLWKRLSRLPGMIPDPGIPGKRVETANLLAFPYDFRQSITHAAERLEAEIRHRMGEPGPSRRVIIVAHSMGGLVARHWIANLAGHRYCRALITLGTPHRGAPKALGILVNGIEVPLVHKRINGVSDLLASWDSVYELLPRYSCIWDEAGQQPMAPVDLPIGGVGGFGDRAKRGRATHADIEAGWRQLKVADQEPKVLPYLGYSHPTLTSATWNGKELAVTEAPLRGFELGAWATDLGDGTVPAISAMPIEMEEEGPGLWRVPFTHGHMTALEAVADRVEEYEKYPTSTSVRVKRLDLVREKQVKTALGVQVSKMNSVGEAIPIWVQRHAAEQGVIVEDGEPTELQITVHRTGRGAASKPVTLPLNWDSKRQASIGEITGLPAGLYELVVSAVGDPTDRESTCATGFAVLNNSALG